MKTKSSHLPLLLVISLVSILACACNEDGEISGQLITNGDVESGSGHPYGWWKNDGNGMYNVEWTDELSYSPKKSLKISTQVADTSEFAIWGQTIPFNIPNGSAVRLNAKVKGNLSGDGAAIAMRGDNEEGSSEQFVTTQNSVLINGQFDWTEYHVKFDEVEAGTMEIHVFLIYLPNTTGEVYFDDISLTF